ncbi:MAG TPA: hypothetical protein V6C85_08290 [Allocoleopsis sp.]
MLGALYESGTSSILRQSSISKKRSHSSYWVMSDRFFNRWSAIAFRAKL